MTIEVNTLHAWHKLLEAANECGLSSVLPCTTPTNDIALMYWFPTDVGAKGFTQKIGEIPDLPQTIWFMPDPLAVVVRLTTRPGEFLGYVAILRPGCKN